jgi:hypothetical protein
MQDGRPKGVALLRPLRRIPELRPSLQPARDYSTLAKCFCAQ